MLPCFASPYNLLLLPFPMDGGSWHRPHHLRCGVGTVHLWARDRCVQLRTPGRVAHRAATSPKLSHIETIGHGGKAKQWGATPGVSLRHPRAVDAATPAWGAALEEQGQTLRAEDFLNGRVFLAPASWPPVPAGCDGVSRPREASASRGKVTP